MHVQQGFKSTDSAVTVYLGGWYTMSGFGPRDTWEERLRHCLAACEPYSPPILLLDPQTARGFVDRGFAHKQQLIDWLADNARVTAREYWDDQWVQTLIKPHAVAGVQPWAGMLAAAPHEMVRKYRAQDISVVVLGGETQGAWKMVGGNFSRAKTVSIDDWR
jgi:hypothetical protein